MTRTLEPDPSYIGGVDQAVFALLPVPMTLFQTRAKRLAFLADGHDLKPYLEFLADLTRLQARLLVQLPPLDPLPEAVLEQARAAGMPPIDRAALVGDAAALATLDALVEAAVDLAMPEAARLALNAVRAADAGDRSWLMANVLGDAIPADSPAPHLFVAAAMQVHLSRIAAGLPAEKLVPVGVGLCPSCGGRPCTSSVKGAMTVENARYAACAGCGTEWNEVRVKCLGCGSTKGISYRSAETHDATVKAECCSECNGWIKIFYQNRNASLEPMADDVGSLGLDMLMRTSAFTRRGFNPWLVGY